MRRSIAEHSLDEIRKISIHLLREKKFQEIFDVLSVALNRLDADHFLKFIFVEAASKIQVKQNNIIIQTALLSALQEDNIDYQKLAKTWEKIIRTDMFFKPLFELKWDNKFLLEEWESLEKVLNHPLLLEGVRKILLESAEFEIAITEIRRITLLKLLPQGKLRTRHIPYICAIAEQCFFNEYSYYIEEDEKNALSLIDKNDPIAVMILACYEPLCRHNIPSKMSPIKEFKHIVKLQVSDFQREQQIKGEIETIGVVDDRISLSVQTMYEQNPYPRWRYLDVLLKNTKTAGKVLVAGCGTGKYLVQHAWHFRNLSYTAVDISSSSIAYAKRMSEEASLDNIDFIKCDILNISEFPDKYDFINCSGVLHHMKDPIAGWKNLVERLAPGGMMLVGLYSTKARKIIDEAHGFIKEKNYTSDIEDIREFRRDIISLPDQHSMKRFLNFKDFYSTSDVRDLVFHIQEKTYDIPEIEQALNELGLVFKGFKIRNEKFLDLYKNTYPEDKAMNNLKNWDELETKTPIIFGEMYNFWCIKKDDIKPNSVMQDILDSGV